MKELGPSSHVGHSSNVGHSSHLSHFLMCFLPDTCVLFLSSGDCQKIPASGIRMDEIVIGGLTLLHTLERLDTVMRRTYRQNLTKVSSSGQYKLLGTFAGTTPCESHISRTTSQFDL
jgi:hypothetical protein